MTQKFTVECFTCLRANEVVIEQRGDGEQPDIIEKNFCEHAMPEYFRYDFARGSCVLSFNNETACLMRLVKSES